MFLPLCILLLASSVIAVSRVSLPFNAQVPPVARVAQYFSFQLSSSTFEPEAEPYQYSLTAAPPWLNIDSASRTLWGTPGAADVGSKVFNITAARAGGGSAVMEATLEVVDYLGPQLKMSVPDQLRDIGKQSRPSNLLLKASEPFGFAFSRDTFVADGKSLTYYATMIDRTPLPAWLSFGADEVKFSGVAPPPDASPQRFDVLLIASDVRGYAGGWAQFTLVISSHELVFEPPKVEVKISKDTPLEYRELRSHLKLDGQPIDYADIANASARMPSWLTFDSSTLDLEGTPPEGTESQDVEVTVYSRFGDAATTTIRLVYVSDLFTAGIGPLVATIGERFSYTFPQSIFTQDNVEVRVNLGSSPRWLTYDSASLTISADVPDDVKPGVVTGVVTVNVVGSSASDSQTFQIQLQAADLPESNPTPLVSTSNSATSQSTDQVLIESSASVSDDVSPPKNSKLLVTIIATVVGLVLLVAAFVAVVLFCCCRKRETRSPPSGPRKSEISRPIIQDDACQRQHDQTFDQDVEKGSDEFERTPERPSQIQIDFPIPIPPKSKLRGQVRQSQVSSLGEGDAVILANFNRSSDWGYDASTPNSHTPHDSMKLPTESLRMALVDSQSRSSRVQSARIAAASPTRERPQSTIYHDPPANTGLPVNRRITGLGHGRNNTYSSPTRSMNRLSALRARDCNSYSSYSTQSTGLLSTTPSTFPAPPSGRPAPPHFSLPSAEKRKSIRMVPQGRSGGSISDRRPLHDRRQSYIRNRAASRSPFFGARESNARLSSLRPLSTLTSTAATPASEKHDPLNTIAIDSAKPQSENDRNRISELYPIKDSLRRQHTHKSVATSKSIGTNWSASSSAEPPMRIRKTWDVHLRARLAGAAGISRPNLARHSSTRSSLRHSRLFESATESLYSQPSMTLTAQEQEGKTEDDDSAWEDARSGSASRSASFVLPPGPAGIGLGLSSLDTSAPGEGLRDFSGHLARDERGNILVYDSPTIEQMNVGIVVGNTGRMSQQRRSRYTSGQAVGHRRRPSEAMLSRGQRLGRAVRESVRVPLGVVKGENERLSPRLKVGESREKRPVSVENGRWGSQRGVVDERGDLAFL